MSAKTNKRTDKRESWRKYVIFLDIGEILEKRVHESSVCDTGVYRFPNFYIFKQFPSAELEINVGVKYVGEDDRTDG
jgi:hypothetical protein